jgi:hypothetical protein
LVVTTYAAINQKPRAASMPQLSKQLLIDIEGIPVDLRAAIPAEDELGTGCVCRSFISTSGDTPAW